jgi:hypothetical protein
MLNFTFVILIAEDRMTLRCFGGNSFVAPNHHHRVQKVGMVPLWSKLSKPMQDSLTKLEIFAEISSPTAPTFFYKGRSPPCLLRPPQCCCSSSLLLLPTIEQRDHPYSTVSKTPLTTDKLVFCAGTPDRQACTGPLVTKLLLTAMLAQAHCHKIQKQG